MLARRDDDGTGGLDGVAAHDGIVIVLGDALDRPAGRPSARERGALRLPRHTTIRRGHEHADFVLPITTHAEQEGTFTNHEGRVQRFWPATPAARHGPTGLAHPGSAREPSCPRRGRGRRRPRPRLSPRLGGGRPGLRWAHLRRRRARAGAVVNDTVDAGAGRLTLDLTADRGRFPCWRSSSPCRLKNVSGGSSPS